MIKPVFDNILIKKIEKDNSTESGILLSTPKDDDINIGYVVALGEASILSAENGGELLEGSKVVFSANFKKLNYKNEEFYIVNEEELLAIIE